MSETRQSIEEGFRKAATAGDLRQFKSLEQSFPAQLDAMRYSDLLDIAATHKHADIILYLAMHHGFEVSPDFEKKLKHYTGELFAEGVNEYSQTLEVVADAATGFKHDSGRSVACHNLRQHFTTRAENRRETIDPAFYGAAANGDLEKFLSRYKNDERFYHCERRHTGNMVSKLLEALPAIREVAGAMPPPLKMVESRQL